jgi:hypothetical protein
VAFGALARVPDWYDPHGPMGVEELAGRMAETLTGVFVGTHPVRGWQPM